MASIFKKLRSHYVRKKLHARILRMLEELGMDLNALSPTALAPLDHFHFGGRDATMQLATLADLDAMKNATVVDIGSGIGGPARTLAQTYGCRVIGVDVMEAYCDIANDLARRSGLETLVSFRCGDARDLPVADNIADLVWTQHVTMNIVDTTPLFSEIRRVAKPGGRVAMSEVLAGDIPFKHFPAPWAPSEAESSLSELRELRLQLESFDFHIVALVDRTEDASRWFRAMLASRGDETGPALNLSTLMGPDFPAMAKNVLRGLEDRSLHVVDMVAGRPEQG